MKERLFESRARDLAQEVSDLNAQYIVEDLENALVAAYEEGLRDVQASILFEVQHQRELLAKYAIAVTHREYCGCPACVAVCGDDGD